MLLDLGRICIVLIGRNKENEGGDSVPNICIVLNYNDADETIKFCDYFSKYRCVDQIVIVDNCSTDDSINRLKTIESDDVLLLCSSANKGYSAGNNVGIKYALENYKDGNIIISNPDIYISEDDLERVLSALNDLSVGMATGLIYTGGRIVSNFAWRIPTAGELLLHNFFVLHKLLKNTKHDFYCNESMLLKKVIDCNCVPGCFFCLRLGMFRQIGLLDERTFLYGEENILGWKIHNSGYRTVVLTESKIEHYGGHSIKKSRTKKKTTRMYAEKSLLLYIKEYLNCNRFQQILFHLIFWIAQLEQDIVMGFVRIRKGRRN